MQKWYGDLIVIVRFLSYNTRKFTSKMLRCKTHLQKLCRWLSLPIHTTKTHALYMWFSVHVWCCVATIRGYLLLSSSYNNISHIFLYCQAYFHLFFFQEIFELSHNGTRFVAEEVMRYETGPNVVMTCAVRNAQNRIYLAAGQESHCQLYRVNVKMVDAAEMRRGSFRAENGLVRRRRTVSENDNISKMEREKRTHTTDKRMSFEIRPCDSVQTDFA